MESVCNLTCSWHASLELSAKRKVTKWDVQFDALPHTAWEHRTHRHYTTAKLKFPQLEGFQESNMARSTGAAATGRADDADSHQQATEPSTISGDQHAAVVEV
jgi:hypothetical protein